MSHGEGVPPEGVANTEVDGVAQGAQAQDITGDIHAHDLVPSSNVPTHPRPRQLPREITHFTGREMELEKLDASLGRTGSQQSSTMVISVIAGAAGIGKTSLALRWAHRVQDQFPDGHLHVNLRGYGSGLPLTASHALISFLGALGVPPERIPEDVDAQAGLYRSLLVGRRLLVLLDNAATPDQIRPLLPNEPACRVLVTSRSRLSGLVAIDGAHRISLEILTPDEARRLLTDIIGHDRAIGEQEAMAELAHRCDYLPLALRIAAERVSTRAHHTIVDLVEELAVEPRRLDVLSANDDETATVRTVFSWSYHALPSDTAQVFRLLGLHPGPTISLEAAAALTGTTTAKTQAHLDTLVGVHLLTETGRDRYQFHDLLRTYAAERAKADDDVDLRDEARQRLYEWYLHTTHSALFAFYPQHPKIPIDPRPRGCHPLTFTDRDHALNWFTAEHDNLMAVIHRAPTTGQYTVGWQLPNSVDCYLAERSHVADRITVHQLGLAATQHLGHEVGERWAYGHLGEALSGAHRYDEAVACHQHGLQIARKIGDKSGEGAALVDLAYCYNQLDRRAEAVDHGQQALEIHLDIGHQRNVSLSLRQLGNAFCGMGQLDHALTYLQQGLEIANTSGSMVQQALALQSLAKVYRQQNRYDLAVSYLKRAAAHFQTLRIDHDYGNVLDELGATLNDMGSLDKARNAWLEAHAILTNLDPHLAAQIRTRLDTLGQ